MAALKSVPIGLAEQSRGVDIPTLFLIVEREKTMQILLNLSSPPTSDKEEVETRELEETRGFDGHDPVFYIGVSIPIVLFIIVDSVLLYVFHFF